MDYKRSLKKSAAEALSGNLPIPKSKYVCQVESFECIEMLV